MTADFLTGFLAGLAYSVALAVLVILWWLSRKEPAERLIRVEREFLAVVKGARR